MTITKQQKQDLIKEFGETTKDTGRPEVQIAILTKEILELTEHLKANKKDVHSKTGLYKKVSKRNSLLAYLKKNDQVRYQKIIKDLKLRG